MKNKMSYSKLALGNLKQRRKQYTVLVIGIILSMFFSSASLFFVASAYSSMEETKNHLYGKEDIIIGSTDTAKGLEEFAEESFISVGKGSIVGRAAAKNADEKIDLIIAKFDDTAKNLYIDIAEGVYPQKQNEIAVEKQVLRKMGINAAIGDYIELKLFPQNGEEPSEEYELTKFKIVGFLQPHASNYLKQFSYEQFDSFMPGAAVSDNYTIAPGGKADSILFIYDDLFDINKYEKAITRLNEFLEGQEACPMTTISYNYRNTSLSSSLVDSVYLVAFLTIVMAVVANIGIVNAFSANLKERKKQIGLLRCVGATKAQIRKIYIRETIVLSFICTPVSIALSLLLTRIITPLLGETFVFKPEFWVIPISIVFSLTLVILSALIPLISAGRVSPMQAIRNIDIQIKMKRFKVKTQREFSVPKLIAKRNMSLMKLRNTFTSIIICVSIIVSCTFITICIIDIDDQLAPPVKSDYQISDYNAFDSSELLANYGKRISYSENNLNDLLQCEYTQSVTTSSVTKGYIEVPELTDYMHACLYNALYYDNYAFEPLTKDNYKQETAIFTPDFDYTKKQAQIEGETFPVRIIAVDDLTLEKLKEAYDGEINISKIKTGEDVILALPSELRLAITDKLNGAYNVKSEKDLKLTENDTLIGDFKCDFKVGQKIKLGSLYASKEPKFDENRGTLKGNQKDINYRKFENNVNICAVFDFRELQDAPYAPLAFGMYGENPTVIISQDSFNNYIEKSDYTALGVMLNTECTDEIDEIYNEITEDIIYNREATYFSNYEKNQRIKENIMTYIIIIISVVFVLFTIAGSLVNNNITARIHESKRAIGTLRAVGASQKELTASYIRQFVSVMLKGTLGGYMAFLLGEIIFLLIRYSTDGFIAATYRPLPMFFFIPVGCVSIAVITLFAICSINMVTKIKKEMKNSIVENIREL